MLANSAFKVEASTISLDTRNTGGAPVRWLCVLFSCQRQEASNRTSGRSTSFPPLSPGKAGLGFSQHVYCNHHLEALSLLASSASTPLLLPHGWGRIWARADLSVSDTRETPAQSCPAELCPLAFPKPHANSWPARLGQMFILPVRQQQLCALSETCREDYNIQDKLNLWFEPRSRLPCATWNDWEQGGVLGW